MRAVNLIPADGNRPGGGLSIRSFGPAHGVVLALVVALVFVTVYVLSSNAITDRTATLASLQVQTARETQLAASLSKYTRFQQLAQARAQTVRSIASSRFNWYRALSDLSRVVPANTSLQSLTATVAPNTNISGASGGAGTGGLRADEPGPAFELSGCADTQDDVARLMSRLRLINGVTRVTLSDSQKPDNATGATPSASAGATGGGCGPKAPTFDMVVFFQPLSGASAVAASAGSSSTPASGTPTTPTTSTSTTPTSTTPTTSTASTQPTTSTATAPVPPTSTGGSR